MPFAVTLRFDPDSALAIERLWNALAHAGIDADRRTLGYGAHITLGIYPDSTPGAILLAAVDRAGSKWPALPVALSGFGVFPGPPTILFAAPVVTPALLARQAEWLDAVPDLPVHPHYRPHRWVPHVTLSGSLPAPDAALNALLPLWHPLEGRLERVDLVQFRPVEILRSHILA